jgi:hypothetical protein
MDDWWVALLREQRSAGFPDVAGAHGTFVLPVSDRLITHIVSHRLPPSVPISEFQIAAHAGDKVTLRVRLARPAFLPPIQTTLTIDQQPDLPASPVLGLVIQSRGMATLAATALRFLDVLPSGIRLDGVRVIVDLRRLLEQWNAADVLTHVTHLKVTTDVGRVIVHVRGGLGAV